MSKSNRAPLTTRRSILIGSSDQKRLSKMRSPRKPAKRYNSSLNSKFVLEQPSRSPNQLNWSLPYRRTLSIASTETKACFLHLSFPTRRAR